jgi:hypothetical protein
MGVMVGVLVVVLGGIQAVMADGSVRFLNNDTDLKVQRALLTAGGAETVAEF